MSGADRWDGWLLRTDSRFDLRHREVLTACQRGLDRFEVAERLLILLDALPTRTEKPGPSHSPRPPGPVAGWHSTPRKPWPRAD